MSKIVVTGATGFLGGEVARHLRRQGAKVMGLGRSPQALRALQAEGITCIAADLATASGEQLADQIGPFDALVHCAALSSAWGARAEFVAANVTGTATAIALAQAAGARRFVNISSPTVYYANRDQISVRESALLPKPVNAYADTKAMAEQLVRAVPEIGPINLRPRGIYGAGDTALLPRLLDAARQGPLPLLRDGVAEIDLTYVTDVVQAVLKALSAHSSAEGESYNISSGAPRRVTDIVTQACQENGVTARWRALPWRLVMAAAGASEALHTGFRPAKEPRLTRYKVGLFAFRQSLDITKAKQQLGWEPKVSFEEGLALTLQGRSFR